MNDQSYNEWKRDPARWMRNEQQKFAKGVIMVALLGLLGIAFIAPIARVLGGIQ